MDKKLIVIENSDGTNTEAQLITYLISEDEQMHYAVYSFGEKGEEEGDEIIYVSRIANNGDSLYLEEIEDDGEWASVQNLLKKIANA